jgi:TrwC relaxase
MADQWPIASHQEISTPHYSLESPLARLLPAYSHTRSILRGEQCIRGALLAPTKAEGAAGWPTSRNSRWVGRPITLASWPLTTNSTCLATASPRAGPGFDVVLRPTKSVSILYGLGDPATGRAVLAAHHAGVAEAAGYLDEHLGVRRGHGGREHVSGQGLLAVGFDHRTSREGDPLLHTHLVANRVQEPDGRWIALDGPVSAPAGRRRHLSGQLPAPAVPDARGRVDSSGRLREPGAGGPTRGPGPAGLQANGPD